MNIRLGDITIGDLARVFMAMWLIICPLYFTWVAVKSYADYKKRGGR